MRIDHYIHYVKDDHSHELLHQILHKVNKLIMTDQEAVETLNALTAQSAKVKIEVEKLIQAVQNNGNVSPELETAITNVKNAFQAVDDLNEDEPTA